MQGQDICIDMLELLHPRQMYEQSRYHAEGQDSLETLVALVFKECIPKEIKQVCSCSIEYPFI